MKKNNIILIIIALALLGTAAYFFVDKKSSKTIMLDGQSPQEEKQELQQESVQMETPESGSMANEEKEIGSADGQDTREISQPQQEDVQRKENSVAQEESPSKTSSNSGLDIRQHPVSWGHQTYSGTRKIDTVIIHSTYNPLGGDQYDFDKILDIYKQYEVSPHYVVERDGSVYQLVKDNDTAYHAGVSEVPDGRTNVNTFSIGIEMIGNKTDGYTDKQYVALKSLVGKIKGEHGIKYVLGHSDIAPGRKDDPWKFDWDKLK